MTDSTELIRFSCPKCEKRLKVPGKWANKKLKCPKCSQVIKIPAINEVASESKPTKHSSSTPASSALSPSDKSPTPISPVNAFDEDDIFGDSITISNSSTQAPLASESTEKTEPAEKSIATPVSPLSGTESKEHDLFGDEPDASISPKSSSTNSPSDGEGHEFGDTSSQPITAGFDEDPFGVDAPLPVDSSSGSQPSSESLPETLQPNMEPSDLSFVGTGGDDLAPLKLDVLDDEPEYKPLAPKPVEQDYSPLGGFDDDGNFHLTENDNLPSIDSAPSINEGKSDSQQQLGGPVESELASQRDEFDLLPLPDGPSVVNNSETTTPQSTESSAGDPFGLGENSVLQDAIAFGESTDAASINFDEDLSESQSTIEEYRVICGTCNTGFYQPIDRAGKHVSCPDCFSEFVAPPLPANWEQKRQSQIEKKKQQAIARAKREEQRLAAVEESQSVSYDNPYVQKSAAQTLEAAERELDADDEEDMAIISDFETGAWIKRTFGLFTDPFAIAITIVASILLALVGYFSEYWGLILQEKSLVLSVIARTVILSLFGIPSLLVVIVNGYAIMATTANNERRVENWPLFDLLGHGGEAIGMGIAFIAAAVPGGVVGWFFGQLGLELVAAVCVVVAVWLLFPISVLSMMDNDSAFQPFSLNVFKTISKKAEAWATLYFVTGLASFALLIVYLSSLTRGPAGWAVSGACTPFAIFFITMQIGVLASRISETLSFEFEPSSTKKDDEPENDIIEQAKAL